MTIEHDGKLGGRPFVIVRANEGGTKALRCLACGAEPRSREAFVQHECKTDDASASEQPKKSSRAKK